MLLLLLLLLFISCHYMSFTVLVGLRTYGQHQHSPKSVSRRKILRPLAKYVCLFPFQNEDSLKDNSRRSYFLSERHCWFSAHWREDITYVTLRNGHIFLASTSQSTPLEIFGRLTWLSWIPQLLFSSIKVFHTYKNNKIEQPPFRLTASCKIPLILRKE